MSMKTWRCSPRPCPNCGRQADSASTIDPNSSAAAPVPGDLTVCFGCGEVLTFGPDMDLLLAVASDLDELDPSDLRNVRLMQQYVRGPLREERRRS